MTTSTAFTAAAAFRVALVYGQRTAQMWTLRKQPTTTAPSGLSFAQIAERFQISRQRVEQLVTRADERLATWPQPNAWQAKMPARLRDLCAFSGFTAPEQVVDVVLGERLPKHWTVDDAKRLTTFCAIDLSARSIRSEIDDVAGELMRLQPRIDALVEAQVPIASSLQASCKVFGRNALTLWDRAQRAATIVALAGGAS